MMNNNAILGLSVIILGTIAPLSAMAETIPTMDQPDNGFYEGPDPEWAVLHSTDTRGTEVHRQYHRDAAQAHLLWHRQHWPEQGIAAYEAAHRLYHQEMNLQHRQFHTAPTSL